MLYARPFPPLGLRPEVKYMLYNVQETLNIIYLKKNTAAQHLPKFKSKYIISNLIVWVLSTSLLIEDTVILTKFFGGCGPKLGSIVICSV